MPTGLKDAGALEAEVRMTRSVHSGAILIVEGPDDARFWGGLVDTGACELVIAEGKVNATGAITRLDNSGFAGALALVDDDRDSLLGRGPLSDNLIRTDAHDLECVLLRSPALGRVLAELGDDAKLTRFVQTSGKPVRAALLDKGCLFGRVWWAAELIGHPIEHGIRQVQRYVRQQDWEIDEQQFWAAVVSGAQEPAAAGLRDAAAALPDADPWFVARGHDLVAILRIGLKRALGNIRNSVGPARISQLLRVAFQLEDLDACELGKRIREWEWRTQGFAILAADPFG